MPKQAKNSGDMHVSLSLPRNTVAAIDRLAAKTSRSRSGMMRNELIQRFAAEIEPDQPDKDFSRPDQAKTAPVVRREMIRENIRAAMAAAPPARTVTEDEPDEEEWGT